MTIGLIIPPYGDLANDDIVDQSIWNGQFDAIFNDRNTVVKPAIDALQAAGNLYSAYVCNARMTLVTGQPFSLTEIIGSANMYISPCLGNLIGLYDGVSTWIPRPFTSDITIAAPAGTRDLLDIFVNWNGSSVVGSTSGYTTYTATNSPAAGYGVVINLSNTTGIFAGDVVSVGPIDCVVQSVNTNVSITVDWLPAGLTTPVVRTNNQLQPLTTVNGILVMASDTTKRFMGTALVNAPGVFVDYSRLRGVANQYNQIQKSTFCSNVVTGNVVNTGTMIPASASGLTVDTTGSGRFAFVTTPRGTAITTQRSEGTTSSNVWLLQSISGVVPNLTGVGTYLGIYQNVSLGNIPYAYWGAGPAIAGSAQFAHIVNTRGRQYNQDYIANTSGSNAAITRFISSNPMGFTSGTIFC